MPGEAPTDADLLRALRRDAETVGLLYDRYASRLAGYLQQHGANEQAALDATQETFARLITHRREVQPGADGTVWPWLAVIGRNLVRDWQRHGSVEARARRRLGLAAASDETAETLSRVEASQVGPRLQVAFARLSAEQRTAVTARVLGELDYRQIADAAGTSEETIRRRVSRGLRAMQTFLQGGDP